MSLLGLQKSAFLLCLHMAPYLHRHVEKLLVFLLTDTSPVRLLRPHLTLIISSKALSPNAVFGDRYFN